MNVVVLSGVLIDTPQLQSKTEENQIRKYCFGKICARDQDGNKDQFIDFIAFGNVASWVTNLPAKAKIEIFGKISVTTKKDDDGNWSSKYVVLAHRIQQIAREKEQYESDNLDELDNMFNPFTELGE